MDWDKQQRPLMFLLFSPYICYTTPKHRSHTHLNISSHIKHTGHTSIRYRTTGVPHITIKIDAPTIPSHHGQRQTPNDQRPSSKLTHTCIISQSLLSTPDDHMAFPILSLINMSRTDKWSNSFHCRATAGADKRAICSICYLFYSINYILVHELHCHHRTLSQSHLDAIDKIFLFWWRRKILDDTPPCEHLVCLTPSNVFPSVIPHNPKQYGPLRRRTEPCPKSTPRSRT
jgi:hypothetical protein